TDEHGGDHESRDNRGAFEPHRSHSSPVRLSLKERTSLHSRASLPGPAHTQCTLKRGWVREPAGVVIRSSVTEIEVPLVTRRTPTIVHPAIAAPRIAC